MTRSELSAALIRSLARGPAGARELLRTVEVSQPVLSRALSALRREGRVVQMGTTRGARYGLSRSIGGVGSRWPLYRIDAHGTPIEIGVLHALERKDYYLPQGPERLRGLGEGIPYALQDARPGGFLGRTVPQQWPELALPPRIADWTDEHFLSYLTQRATDNIGDLVLGERSIERLLAGSDALAIIDSAQRASGYAACAAAAMAGTPAGAAAQGEQPKFLARLEERERRTHVLVKFSPPRTSETGQRWADLLVCEHLAHEVLERAGIASCRSRLFAFDDRTYLEVERFDRLGAQGRRGGVSLYAVDLTRYGKLDRWSECARRLHDERLLSSADTERIGLLEAFAMLIANTDRHFGNITLFDRYEGAFELAPAYDMLPMLFAPQHEQIVERQYVPPTPTAALLRPWPEARALAERYWALLADEERLSEPFRRICADCLQTLRAASSNVNAFGARLRAR